MIALDQKNVFDRVDWNVLFKALQHVEYWPEIIHKVKTVYQNIETEIKVASFSSEAWSAARMPIIYDSVNYICWNIFREHITKEWGQGRKLF